MRRTLFIYRRLLGAHIRAALQYDTDFWLLILGAVLTQVVGVVFLSAIFARIPTLAGWTFWDVVLIYAMVTLGEGVSSLFFEGQWRLAWMINQGELDYALTRPYPVVLQVMGAAVGFNGIGNLTTGGILLGLGLANAQIVWTPWTVAMGVVLFVASLIIKVAISLGTNSVSFWITGPFSVFGYAMHQVGDLARYPITIYAVGIRLAIGVVIPFAFISYFPVSLLLGDRPDSWVGLLTPLVAVWCVAAALFLFRRGLRRYESAGN
jgi:ABC-2 type transport system permease protein